MWSAYHQYSTSHSTLTIYTHLFYPITTSHMFHRTLETSNHCPSQKAPVKFDSILYTINIHDHNSKHNLQHNHMKNKIIFNIPTGETNRHIQLLAQLLLSQLSLNAHGVHPLHSSPELPQSPKTQFQKTHYRPAKTHLKLQSLWPQTLKDPNFPWKQ